METEPFDEDGGFIIPREQTEGIVEVVKELNEIIAIWKGGEDERS